jgi:CheY-like chemotaxis protein
MCERLVNVTILIFFRREFSLAFSLVYGSLRWRMPIGRNWLMSEIIPKNHRILIIDDNRAIHDAFRKILCPPQSMREGLEELDSALFDSQVAPPKRISFEVASAFQGQEGLELAQEAFQAGHPYATAFVDVRMPPGWDGIETTARIWRIDPELEIVICTAYSDYSWDELSAKLGHSDRFLILKKPFEIEEVLQLAITLTEKWHLRQEAKLRLSQLESIVQERTKDLKATNTRLEEEIVERKKSEAAREMLIKSLEEALANVKALSGLIPICAGCKQIRDDQGYWSQVETYISQHSEARFTHGLCPNCAGKYFPDIKYPEIPDSSKTQA